MRKPRKPTDEERALWRTVTKDVIPLQPAAPEPKPAPPAAATPGSPAAAKAKPPKASAAPPAALSPSPKLGPKRLEIGDLADIDGRRAARLRRGKLVVEGRIDLHGMRRDEAHDALLGFLAASHRQGRRVVLVITGKGTFSEGDGVLRAQVPRWLNEPPLRGRIVAVSEAHPRDGGAGALYIVLKRQRGEPA